MKFVENEVRQIAAETWQIVLGEELQPCLERITPEEIEDPIGACAKISGNWQLAVVVYCSAAVARHAARVMFGADDGKPPADDVHDALCEIVNIIAGNVKGVLSGSSQMSLPNLVKEQDFKAMFSRHVLLSEANFTCRGEPVLVVLLGEDRMAARKQGQSADGVAPRN